jgi:hypothetical protein
MTLFKWMESKTRNLKWYDISLTKLATAAFALMAAKLWPALLSLDWTVYLVVFVIAAIRPCYSLFASD